VENDRPVNIIAATKDGESILHIGARDLGPLFRDKMGLSCNELSPFAGRLAGYAAGSLPTSAKVESATRNTTIAKIASILTQPDLRIDHRYAGTHVSLTAFTACCSREHGRELVVVVFPAKQNSYLVRAFNSSSDYLSWWLGLLASKADRSVTNYLPSPLPLESLIYIFHAIDSFRRVSCQSLLNYTPTREPFIRMSEFVESMSKSIGSRDLRWLMPSLLILTPGLSEFTLHPRMEHLTALVDHGYLVPAKDPESHEDIFFFAKAGENMGAEFSKTWEIAVGLETRVQTERGSLPLQRAFLAPTIISNHFIQLERDRDGRCLATHQAMTIRELTSNLSSVLFAGLDPARAARAVRQAPQRTTSSSKGKLADSTKVPALPSVRELKCQKCGQVSPHGKKFCGECGSPLPSKKFASKPAPVVKRLEDPGAKAPVAQPRPNKPSTLPD
jgi:hypothetical protein